MRLTQKNEFFEYALPCQNVVGDNQATEISLGETEYTCKKYIIGEAINKLGELEDVLEKYGIESAEDLDNIINSIRTNTFIDIENKEILELENANLKSELAELKQSQKQLAISELEKLKDFFLEPDGDEKMGTEYGRTWSNHCRTLGLCTVFPGDRSRSIPGCVPD